MTKMLTFLSFPNNFSRASTPMLCSMPTVFYPISSGSFLSLGSVPVEAADWRLEAGAETDLVSPALIGQFILTMSFRI